MLVKDRQYKTIYFMCRMAMMKTMKETYISVIGKPGCYLRCLEPSSWMHVPCQHLKARLLQCLAMVLISDTVQACQGQ